MRYMSVIAIASIALAAATPTAMAQKPSEWPQKNVTIIVPAPAGGASDSLARLMAEDLRTRTGKAMVVDNKPGASGQIAVQALLSAEPDGHTVVILADTIATEIPHVIPVRYDPLKDLKPIAEIARTNLLLVANPALPAQNLREFIAHAKANPGKLSFASYSNGTASHYAGLIFNQKAGLDLLHVPYKGAPPAQVDVMSGQVPVMFDGVSSALSLIRGGKLKPIAVLSDSRTPHLKDVPTFKELGYPDLNFAVSFVVFVSGKVPADLVARMHSELMKTIDSPKLKQVLADQGWDPSRQLTPAQHEASLAAVHAGNAAIVKAFNIKAE